MDVVLFARLLLATVFAVAALAKLADRMGSRQAIIDFGVPVQLAVPLGVVLPLGELVVAAALLSPGAVREGAIGALLLLSLFVVAIGVNLARGRRPDCHCFGQLHSAPVGWPTLARNALLALMAGLVAWQVPETGGASLVGWLGKLKGFELAVLIAGLVLLGLVVAEGRLLMSLLRQNGRLLLRLDALEAALVEEGVIQPSLPVHPPRGLSVGSQAPTFRLPDLEGRTHTFESLLAGGKPGVLLFTDPDCGPCRILLPEISRWQRDHTGELTIVLISQGSARDNRALSRRGVRPVLLQEGEGVSDAYNAAATPAAVLVRPNGTIGSPVASGPDEIRRLVARALQKSPVAWAPSAPRRIASPAPPALGQPAPAFELPDLSGRRVSLTEFRGSNTVVLFWNPGCPFCQQMLPELKAWEARHKELEPKLLVVSTGTAEENRAMGLRSPVVLDEDFEVATSFGADGTPMAVLVEVQGRVASDVAEGAEAVLSLCQKGARSRAWA